MSYCLFSSRMGDCQQFGVFNLVDFSTTPMRTQGLSQVNDYGFRCYMCPRMFYTSRALCRHLAVFHFRDKLPAWNEETENRCLDCNLVFFKG